MPKIITIEERAARRAADKERRRLKALDPNARKQGRQWGFTKKQGDNIVAFINEATEVKAMLSKANIAELCRIPPTTLSNWIKQADNEDAPKALRSFAGDFVQAYAHMERAAVMDAYANAGPREKFQFLAQLKPDRYSEKRLHVRHEHSHSGTVEHVPNALLGKAAELLIKQLGGGEDHSGIIDVTPIRREIAGE